MDGQLPDAPLQGYTLNVFVSKEDVRRLEGIVDCVNTETSMTPGQAISYLIQLEAARQSEESP